MDGGDDEDFGDDPKTYVGAGTMFCVFFFVKKSYKNHAIVNLLWGQYTRALTIQIFSPCFLSGPPADTGLHRYVFLLYKQQGGKQSFEVTSKNKIGGRQSFEHGNRTPFVQKKKKERGQSAWNFDP